MTWTAFFIVWFLLCVAFVSGCAYASEKWKRKNDATKQQLATAILERDTVMRLLAQARQPKITILAQPEAEETYDWKRGVGVE